MWEELVGFDCIIYKPQRAEECRAGEGEKALTTQHWNSPLDCEMTWSLEVGHYLFKAARYRRWQEVLVCKAGLMFNSSGAVIPRVCLFPTLNPTTLLPLLSPAQSAPTSGSATRENGRNNTAFVHHSALGLLLNKCSEEFWWLALPLGPGWSHSDFINTHWGDQKNKSPFMGSYMVMELFPHQLKFTFLSPCPHADYLFCSYGRKGNFLLPKAQTFIL